MAEPLIALVTFALAATLSPGGATALAAASGAQIGYVRSLPLIAGVALTLALIVCPSQAPGWRAQCWPCRAYTWRLS